ncbi:putative RNA-directed DNA polymerase [Helianthus annuus]|nr:putative RNA-directed DNA polymerase [Helianthus annuus]
MRGVNIHDVYYAPSFTRHHHKQINSSTKTSGSLLLWHHKLGHPSIKVLKPLLNKLGLNCNKNVPFHCDACSINKSHKLPFGPNSFTVSKPLELVYSDVWGPVQTSNDGYTYYVIFVDYFSKYTWLYPMKQKSDVSILFPQFKTLVEKFFGTPLVSLFSDNGGEYIGIIPYLQTNGISHFTTPPHTPEQNGVAERRHRHIVETGLSLLYHANLPLHFWTHAFQTVVYLINRLPTPVLDHLSPFTRLYKTNPKYTKLKPFGCLCFPWLRPYASSKLHPRSTKCIFLGYSSSKSAFKCYDPVSHRLYHSRHVEFVEHVFPFHSTPAITLPSVTELTIHPPSSPLPSHTPTPTHILPPNPPTSPTTTHTPIPPNHTSSLPPSPTTSTAPTEPTTPSISSSDTESSSATPSTDSPSSNTSHSSIPSPPPVNSRPQRTRKPNSKYFNPNVVNTTTTHPIPPTLEPTSHTQALKDQKWRAAMDCEFNALLQNATWELVPHTSTTPIGCKWVYRIKRNPDGSIDKYKARFVAKGFHQQYGKDYFETFSPVTKPVTIRTILSIALSKNWPLRQLDVNNAFLHGILHEDVFMVQPPGYVHPQFPNHVCKLKKSLYGLKQAPRAWYNELTNFLLQFGFHKSLSDASLFIYNRHNTTCYFMVYVDDIVLTGNQPKFLDHFIQSLSNKFSVKDLGMLHHFLGVEVIPTSTGLFLSQHRHIQDILHQFKMDGAKIVTTPLSTSDPLCATDPSPSVDATPYRKLVGSLQYLAFTRPVNKLSQFMHNPRQAHWQALKRVLRYLKGTIHHGLFLNRNSPLTLSAFSDSDWGGTNDAGRSTTAYILYLGTNIISWKSARQKSVSRSSTEAEYKALANASAELTWLKHLLQELGITTTQPPTLFCDNTGATYLCANPIYHSRMKHVALDYHFVREQVTSGLLRVLHINSKDQLADMLTKPLSRTPFLQNRSKIGVSDGSSILRGRIRQCNNQGLNT